MEDNIKPKKTSKFKKIVLICLWAITYSLGMAIMYLLYTACRFILAPIGWKGIPAFKYWMQDVSVPGRLNMRIRHISILFFVLIFCGCWLYIHWLVAASYALIFVIIGFWKGLQMRRSFMRTIKNESDNLNI